MTTLPTFEAMRRTAYAELGDVEDGLRSDWAPGTGPTSRQAAYLRDARLHIARAKTSLTNAAQAERNPR